MPFCFTEHGLLVFVHVPKTGGTSIEDHLEARFGHVAMRDHRWDNRDLDGRSLVMSPQHMTGPDLDRILPPERRAMTFAVVRDPVARMVSEYRYQATGHFWIAGPWRKRFHRRGVSVWLAMALAAGRRAPWFLDGHLRPQVDFLPAGECEVFRYEDGLDRVSDALDARFGPAPGGAAIGHRLKSEKAGAVRLSAQDVALVLAAHGADYDRFGYARPDLSALPRDRLAWAKHLAGRLLAPLALWLYRTGRM